MVCCVCIAVAFTSGLGWVNNQEMFIFWVNCSFNCLGLLSKCVKVKIVLVLSRSVTRPRILFSAIYNRWVSITLYFVYVCTAAILIALEIDLICGGCILTPHLRRTRATRLDSLLDYNRRFLCARAMSFTLKCRLKQSGEIVQWTPRCALGVKTVIIMGVF